MAIDPVSSTPAGAALTRAAGAMPGSGNSTSTGASGSTTAPPKAAAGDSVQLSPGAQALVAKLKARDADVRAHEAAHMAAGGSLVQGGPTFSYQQGPDGKSYAVGGEVSIDTSAVAGNPRATIAKAQQIQAAALAPADPSGQDESVASQAAAMAASAEAQLAASTGGAGAGTKGAAAKPGSLLDVTG